MIWHKPYENISIYEQVRGKRSSDWKAGTMGISVAWYSHAQWVTNNRSVNPGLLSLVTSQSYQGGKNTNV